MDLDRVAVAGRDRCLGERAVDLFLPGDEEAGARRGTQFARPLGPGCSIAPGCVRGGPILLRPIEVRVNDSGGRDTEKADEGRDPPEPP